MKNEIKTMTIKEQNSKIVELAQAIKDGGDAMQRAGNIMVELVDADPHVYDYITKQCPSMTPGMLNTLERIGRGQIIPALAMDNSPGSRKLKSLPISLQQRFETEPIPLIVMRNDEPDVLLVKREDMTAAQANQAFRNGRLSTEGEQRAWIEDYKMKAQTAKPAGSEAASWEIRGKVLVVGNVRFSQKQLLSFAAQMA
jgi:hypothetical protein